MPNLKVAYFVYGRFNPPTKGHRALIDDMLQRAERGRTERGEVVSTFIVTTHTQDNNKNPLGQNKKKQLLRLMAPTVTGVYGTGASGKNGGPTRGSRVIGWDPDAVIRRISQNGNKFDKFVMVVGHDRFNSFSKIFGQKPNVTVVQGGSRNANSRNSANVKLNGNIQSTNISASLARKIARDPNLNYATRRQLLEKVVNLNGHVGSKSIIGNRTNNNIINGVLNNVVTNVASRKARKVNLTQNERGILKQSVNLNKAHPLHGDLTNRTTLNRIDELLFLLGKYRPINK